MADTPALPYEAEARAFALAHNYDIEVLMFERDRYAFGSLSLAWNGQHQRNMRWRALKIAHEHQRTQRTAEAA